MIEIRRGGRTFVEIEAKSVLNRVRGMPFSWSINPYRGCFHECVFCYARSTHAFYERDGTTEWGSRIYVKRNAVAVVRGELSRRSYDGGQIAIGTATDPYQPAEGTYRLTRGILREIARVAAPSHVTTRSPLVIRDIDVLREVSARAKFSVAISLPTLDANLARELEPGVAPPAKRLLALERLAAAGIRAGIALAPVVPGLTDDPASLRAIFAAAHNAGASFVWHGVLNLGDVAKDSFATFLREKHPELTGEYSDMYRARYAPRTVTDRIDRAVAAATLPMAPPPTIVPPEPVLQTSLF